MADKHSESVQKAITFSERLTWAQKSKDNFRWAEIKGEAYDAYYGDYLNDEYKNNVEDNFRLLSGDAMVNYTKLTRKRSKVDARELREEGLDAPNTQTEYFDYVTPAVRGIVGDQQQSRLIYVVTDSSGYTQNYIQEEADKLITQQLVQSIIMPKQQQILMQYAEETGIQDFFKLGPQERMQMQSDISARTDAATPQEIKKFFKYGSKGKLEQAGQAIADTLVHALDIKLLLDEALYYAFATGGIVFTHGIRRLKPFAEIVDLLNFNTWGFNDLMIDTNSGFKRVQMLHPSQIYTADGDKFNKNDRQKFANLVDKGSVDEGKNPTRDRKFLGAIDIEGLYDLNNMDLQTHQGQMKYGSFLDYFEGARYNDLDDVRVADMVWQSLRKFKWITRAYPNGVIKKDYHDESYTFDPNNGDIKEEIQWAPEYWRDKMIGRGPEAIHIDKGPLPAQYRDPTDPYTVRSNYTGVFFNYMMGHGKFKAPLDYVKSKIHMVNFEMKTIKEREATDIGKVVMMTVAAKPKGWTWGKLLEVIRATKMIPINTGQGGLSPADVQFFRDIDLGTTYELLPRINLLVTLVSHIEDGLYYNKARSGAVPASTSVSNNISNINRSFAQTSYLNVWLNKVAERVIENLIYYGKLSIKGGNIFLRRVLDDVSIATIDVDVHDLDDAIYNVQVLIDAIASGEIDMAKAIVQPAMQNAGPAFLKYAVALTYAKNRGEVNGILDEVQMQAEIEQARAAEGQQVAQAQQASLEKDLLELKQNFELVLEQVRGGTKKEVAALQSMTIAHGNDVNKNMENDYIESAREDREVKREELQIQREELSLKDKWETVKAEIAKSKPTKR